MIEDTLTTTVGDVTFDVADLFDWLPAHAGAGALVTMLPDAAELPTPGGRPMDMTAYRGWLRAAAGVCFDASTGPTVFMQTDRLAGGRWTDKAHIIHTESPWPLLWHKIALRRAPGSVDIYRPAYTHIMAFGPGRPGTRTPDVIDAGPRWWANGAGEAAAAFVADWFRDVGVDVVLNPAAGVGTFAWYLSRAGVDVMACDVVTRGDQWAQM